VACVLGLHDGDGAPWINLLVVLADYICPNVCYHSLCCGKKLFLAIVYESIVNISMGSILLHLTWGHVVFLENLLLTSRLWHCNCAPVLQVWAANYTTLFEFSSIGVVFVLLYSYSLSLITMAFSLSIMFTKVGPDVAFIPTPLWSVSWACTYMDVPQHFATSSVYLSKPGF